MQRDAVTSRASPDDLAGVRCIIGNMVRGDVLWGKEFLTSIEDRYLDMVC